MKSPPSLHRQIVIYAVSMLAGSLFFVMAGTYVYLSIYEYLFYQALSPEAALAYERNWSETGMPSADLVEEISIAEERYLAIAYENEFGVMIALSLIALVSAFWIVPKVSKRLTRPIETASKSARAIAGGDFAHVMQISGNASSEVLSLSQSFDHLAGSLRSMEDNVRYTSASISHEIRTPLTVIQGYLQGIRDGVFTADDEQLDLMLSHTQALSTLVDDLKLVSLAEAGELVLRPEKFLLDECLNEAVSFMRAQSTLSNIQFERQNQSVYIIADRERLRQVVLGLLSNSARYGGENVSCLVKYEADGDDVTIQLLDNGKGFSADALSSAKDRFWRGDPSRSRESGGSGLGLAVAQAIVSAHGGELSLSNQSGGGAMVAISLPGAVSIAKDA
ncbi:MAG: ATP-binding protein [Henriciella sp.]